MTLKSDRQKANKKKSDARGAATRAANVKAANQQRTTAEKKGGRFQEGSTVTTVIKGGTTNEKGGTDFKVNLSETLKIRDKSSASVVARSASDSITTREKEDSSFNQRSESDFTKFDEVGEVSAPPIKQPKKGFGFSGNIDINFDRLFKDPEVKQGIDTFVNFGRDIVHDPFLLGSASSKPAIDLSKSIKEGRQETSIDLISQAKFKEAFEKKGVRSSLAVTAALVIAPIGGAKASKEIPTALNLLKRQKQIQKLETELILPSQSQKLGKGKLTGVGDETVITGGGLEGTGKQIPIFLTQFTSRGKPSVFEVTPKPAGKPILTIKEATISGKLDPVTVKELGATKRGSFEVDKGITLTSKDLPATKFDVKIGGDKSSITLKKGLEQDELRQFAVVKETTLDNILKGKSQAILKDIRKPPSVFVQSKAEKLAPSDRNVGKPSTAFSVGEISLGKGGAGQVGKAKVFSGEQVGIIKQKFTPTKQAPAKQQQEILFSAPRFPQETQQAGQAFGQVVITQQQPKPKGGLTTEIITGTQQKQINIDSVKPKNKQTGISPSLKFSDSLSTNLQTPKLITTPTTTFKITDDLITKITTKPKQTFIPAPDPTLTPPPTVTEIPPIIPKVPIAILAAPPQSSRDFDTPSRLLGKTKGFFGNVPQDSIIGIVRKAPTITVSEKAGFFKRQFKQQKGSNILGGKIKIGIGSTKKTRTKKSKKSRKPKSISFSIYGKSNGIKLRL